MDDNLPAKLRHTPLDPHADALMGRTLQLPGCGCNITGAGTLPDPVRIVFCAAHDAASPRRVGMDGCTRCCRMPGELHALDCEPAPDPYERAGVDDYHDGRSAPATTREEPHPASWLDCSACVAASKAGHKPPRCAMWVAMQGDALRTVLADAATTREEPGT